jgi:hypothetical protein
MTFPVFGIFEGVVFLNQWKGVAAWLITIEVIGMLDFIQPYIFISDT